jgi:hypothetical protein
MSLFRLKTRNSLPWEEVVLTLATPRGGCLSEAENSRLLRLLLEQLRDLMEYGDHSTITHVTGWLKQLAATEQEAYDIANTLNGPGHEGLRDDEATRLVDRHRELRSYAYAQRTAANG